MDLHEYQAKQLFKSYGIKVSKGILCYTPMEVQKAYDFVTTSERNLAVVKAQVHAGGRGKAGGVKLVRSATEANKVAEEMLGMRLVTPQTGAEGKLVKKLYVEAGTDISHEYYLSLVVDRSTKSIGIIASPEGGMDIEEVAHSTPEKIFSVSIDTSVGLQNFQISSLANSLGFDKVQSRQFAQLLKSLYQCFMERDLSMLEINPLVLNTNNELIVLDGKVSIDDNALYRQPEVREYVDYDEQNAKDIEASRYGLNYIALDGNIGCMVNGAGLAMATMDIIKHFNGEPANFLDVGGGATKEKVIEAFKILLSDDKVSAILVNIFGGIMRCDVIAEGIVAAAKELSVQVPLVVRLQGTNVDLGKKILAESGLKLVPATYMDEAAEKVVQLAKG